MADVVISEFMDEAIAREVLADCEVLYDPSLVDDRDALLAALSDARALIVRNRTQVDSELLAHGPGLKVIGRLGVGLDNIDMEACERRDVAVCPAIGANDIAVAEYALSAALILLRGVWLSSDRMIAGDWPRTELMGREAAGKQLGLIGFGSIAREVATRANALGMTTAAFDPYVGADESSWAGTQKLALDELAGGCDVISVHVPLTPETHHLVNADLIGRMKRGAVLINTARGGVVDESALIEALRSGRLGGAALDVFESEPLTSEDGAKLADVPNLLLTPHIAGITEEANVRVSRVTAENVRRHLS
ncbi:MAG: hydroxyacid dehydrogenase [Woeseiaceae bacterium]|nr:hydroxyacid dehydrogenase [Woeseiaceae bacterium]